MSTYDKREETILLCTIVPESKLFLDKTLEKIKTYFKPQQIFILKTTSDEEKKYILTYNVPKSSNFKYKDLVKSTFQIHRKKEYNVLYTLNALNKIIGGESKEKNQEIQVEWEKYKNSIILIRNKNDLHIVPTIIYDIVKC